MLKGQERRFVYLLWHSRPLGDHPDSPETDDKLLGVFESNDAAEKAKASALPQPGFRDWPDAFGIDRYEISKQCWTEGFG